MTLFRSLAVVVGVVLAAGLGLGAQRTQEPPSIAFGEAQVSLGMTVEQVEKKLADSARHIQFLADKHTALVRINNTSVRKGNEGQVTFVDGRVVYVAFHFPVARNANDLAQGLAGAVENMDAKICAASNYSAHGTGGGFSQVIFDCGSKSFNVITVETLGNGERYTHVEITMGAIGTK